MVPYFFETEVWTFITYIGSTRSAAQKKQGTMVPYFFETFITYIGSIRDAAQKNSRGPWPPTFLGLCPY